MFFSPAVGGKWRCSFENDDAADHLPWQFIHPNLENGATTGETDDNMNKSESGSNAAKIQP
jgi:hypothetical protein